MALSETPQNPFAGDDLANNIRAEKVQVLEMIAKHGTEGYRIYDDARKSMQGHEEATTGRIDSGRFAPVSVLKSLAGRHNQALDAAIGAIADLRASEGEFFDDLSRGTGRVMDMALEDRSGQLLFDERKELFESRTRELEANLRPYDLRARRPESSGSGGGRGGGGRRGRGGGGSAGSTTLPLGLLSQYTGVELARGAGSSRGRAFTEGLRRTRGITPADRRTVTRRGSGGSRTFGRSTRRRGGGGQSTYK